MAVASSSASGKTSPGHGWAPRRRDASPPGLESLEAYLLTAVSSPASSKTPPGLCRRTKRRETAPPGLHALEAIPLSPSAGLRAQARPLSAHEGWQSQTLAALAKAPKGNASLRLPALSSCECLAVNQKQQTSEVSTATPSSRCDDEDVVDAAPASLMSPGTTCSRSMSHLDTLQWSGDVRACSKSATNAERVSLQGSDLADGKTSISHLESVLPAAELVLQRLMGGASSGFSKSETARMKAAFLRKRVPGADQEVYKEDLAAILKHLGYIYSDEAPISQMADEISEFSTLEYEEFVKFMYSYAKFEHGKFKEVFASVDGDGNGVLDVEEIMQYLTRLGYTPLRSTVKYAMRLVDLNGNGVLDFEELVLLIHLYRHTEGFTQDELEQLNSIFSSEQKVRQPGHAKELTQVARLTNILTKFFGPKYAAQANALCDELKSASYSNSGDLQFSEVLVWARRLRDDVLKGFREAFDKYDEDGSKTIDRMELRHLLADLGYTLSDMAISEMVSITKERGDWHEQDSEDELDYDAFVHFMMVLRETEGFTRPELEEIKTVFTRFDIDRSEDIDVVEVNDMLHYYGYSTTLEEVFCLLARMGYPKGSLDLPEFICFMRLRREWELRAIRDAYDAQRGEGSETLSAAQARKGFIELALQGQVLPCQWSMKSESWQPGGASASAVDLKSLPIAEQVGFEEFVRLEDANRSIRVQELRKRAGFASSEVLRYRGLFDEHDSNSDGYLNTEEFSTLLIKLGFPLRTVGEQRDLVHELETAKQTVVERGIEPDEDGKVSFWVILQLLRGLRRKTDTQTMRKIVQATAECNLKPSEVAEFQELFMQWCRHDCVDVSHQGHDHHGHLLAKISLLSLLSSSLKLKVEARERSLLTAKIADLTENRNSNGAIDFADFLRIMRWMLDTNFCNINKLVSSAG